jgi:hypothetical protein
MKIHALTTPEPETTTYSLTISEREETATYCRRALSVKDLLLPDPLDDYHPPFILPTISYANTIVNDETSFTQPVTNQPSVFHSLTQDGMLFVYETEGDLRQGNITPNEVIVMRCQKH